MFDSTEYNDISLTAAELEQKGLYQQAAGLWEQAHTLAKHDKNRTWSLARKDFCRSSYAINFETKHRLTALV